MIGQVLTTVAPVLYMVQTECGYVGECSLL